MFFSLLFLNVLLSHGIVFLSSSWIHLVASWTALSVSCALFRCDVFWMLRSQFNVTFCKWQETSSLAETCGLSDDHNMPKYNGNEMTNQNTSVGVILFYLRHYCCFQILLKIYSCICYIIYLLSSKECWIWVRNTAIGIYHCNEPLTWCYSFLNPFKRIFKTTPFLWKYKIFGTCLIENSFFMYDWKFQTYSFKGRPRFDIKSIHSGVDEY